MNNGILKKIEYRLINYYFKRGQMSYSQAGEDMILNCIFLSKSKGVYVDVGANHPTKASNTYYFYKKGWTGINIDASPDAIQLFNKHRNKDINIAAGISDIEDNLNFYIFQESSYNTFNADLIDEIKKASHLIDVKNILVKPLHCFLNQHGITEIDFMSIDVEGMDLRVLNSNDWSKYRPKVILVEEFNHGNSIINSPIYDFMQTKGYVYFCQTVTNAFYIENEFYNQRFVTNDSICRVTAALGSAESIGNVKEKSIT